MINRGDIYLDTHRRLHRASLELFDVPEGPRVALLGFVVSEQEYQTQAPDHPLWRELHRDLHRLKWIDGRALALLDNPSDLGLLRAEVINRPAAARSASAELPHSR